ncbi:unnamed protein product [Penicillium palitans]
MKFTAAIGVAALFMAPSAAAWKLPHANKADAAAPTGTPSSSFPGGFPSGTPTGFPSGTPSVTPSGTPSGTPTGFPTGWPTPTGFSFGRRAPGHGPGIKGPGHGGHGHGDHGHGSESTGFPTISSTAVPSGFPESTGVPPGFPGGFSGSQASSGSFTVLPVATATAATVGEQGDFTRRHARHMLF